MKNLVLVPNTFAIIVSLLISISGSAFAVEATSLQQYVDPMHEDAARFGSSVSSYLGQPLVGEPLSTDGGHVYMYNAGLTNTPIQTFSPPSSFSPRSFGTEVVSAGSRLLISDTAALPLSGNISITTGPTDSTPYNFRGVVIKYASAADVLPQVIINPIISPSTAFGTALAMRADGKFAVGDPSLTTASLTQVGAVYVYNTSSTSPTITISNPLPGSQTRFGRSLAYFSDDVVFAASPGEETAYHGALAIGAPGLNSVFEYNPESGDLLNILETPDTSADAFGFSVTTADTRLIVGAPNARSGSLANAGKVYIYDRFTGLLQRTITAPTATRDSFFGYDLTMLDSSRLIVGTWSPGTTAGVVRIYDINTGQLLYTLTSPNTKRPQFGSAVAAAGVNIVVGDPLGASDASTGLPGRAYLYGLAPPVGVVPAAPSNLTASAANASSIILNFNDNSNNETGFSIERHTIGGSFAAIGTVPANTTTFTDTNLSAGTEYWYRVRAFNNTGNSGYSNEASAITFTVTPPDFIAEVPNPGTVGDLFGYSISKLGKARVVVGAPGTDTGGTTESGRVYVYTPPSLTPSMVLDDPNPTQGARFGFSVSAVGENILVGAPGNDLVGIGHAYLFSGTTGQVLRNYTDPTGIPGRQFGYSVGYYGKKQALVGAPGGGLAGLLSGRAYLFDAAKTGALVRAFDSVTSAPSDRFGTAVAGAKGRAAITVPNPGGTACTSGRVELFSLKTGAFSGQSDDAYSVVESKGRFLVGAPMLPNCIAEIPQAYLLKGAVPQAILANPTGVRDGFGLGLAGGKKFNAIGAPLSDDGNTADSGRAYLFSSKSASPIRTYGNPLPGAGDQFGFAMGQAGKGFMYVSAPYDDAHGADAGSVYLFAIPKK